jgi:hypothetical protein
LGIEDGSRSIAELLRRDKGARKIADTSKGERASIKVFWTFS